MTAQTQVKGFYPVTKIHDIYINEQCKLFCLDEDIYDAFYEKYKDTLLSKRLDEQTKDKEIPELSAIFGKTIRLKHLLLVGDVNDVNDILLSNLFPRERLENNWYNIAPKENGDIQQSCKDFTPTEMLKHRLETYARSYKYVNKIEVNLINGILINWSSSASIKFDNEVKPIEKQVENTNVEIEELDIETIKGIVKDIEEND